MIEEWGDKESSACIFFLKYDKIKNSKLPNFVLDIVSIYLDTYHIRKKKKKVLPRAMTYGTLCAEKMILGIGPDFLKLNWAFFFSHL